MDACECSRLISELAISTYNPCARTSTPNRFSSDDDGFELLPEELPTLNAPEPDNQALSGLIWFLHVTFVSQR